MVDSGPFVTTKARAPAHGSGPYRLVAREGNVPWAGTTETRRVRIGSGKGGPEDGSSVEIGGSEPVVIAGPCAVESRAQTLRIAREVKAAGARALRGGAFKPRTSPYDFQGLGREGLEILAEARAATGLPIVTEVLDVRLVTLVAEFADCIQVGARSMQNVPLLREVARTGKPVLLKRHWAATLTEWLCAAEYIALEGNLDIVLCERGIRTFTHTDYNRNSFDVNVIPAVRRATFLPILADPSHGTGDAALVAGASLAAIAAGAHGLIVEVIAEECRDGDSLCDGFQSVRSSALARTIETAKLLASRRPESGT